MDKTVSSHEAQGLFYYLLNTRSVVNTCLYFMTLLLHCGQPPGKKTQSRCLTVCVCSSVKKRGAHCPPKGLLSNKGNNSLDNR